MKQLKPKATYRMVLYIALLLCAIVAMWMLGRCSSSRTASERVYEKSDGDTIDVAIELSPMSIYTYADTLGGFNYDLARAVGESSNLNLRFHPIVSIEKAIEGLDNGTFDIVVADLPLTVEYQEKYACSEPVYLDKQVLVQRRDSAGNVEVSHQLDLAGKTVWVVANTPVASRLRNLAAEIGDTIYVHEQKEYNSEQLFILTAIGDVKLSVVNEKVASAMKDNYPDVDLSTDVSFTQFQTWLMRKNDSLLVKPVNEGLLKIKATKDYENLIRRYK